MADSNIPGRRISHGDSFYTDWFSRGGDSMLLRGETIIRSSTGNPAGTVKIEVITRAEPGATETTIAPTYVPSGSDLSLAAAAVYTGYWRATTAGGSGTPFVPNSLQAQIRLKLTFVSGSAGDYLVVRIFPPIFFDNAKA